MLAQLGLLRWSGVRHPLRVSKGNIKISTDESSIVDLPGFYSRLQVLLKDLIAAKLVAQGQPSRSRIVFPPKDLDLAATRTHAFDETVDFVGLARRLTYLRHDNVSVEPTIAPGRKDEASSGIATCLHTDKHVLLGVIQPVSGAPSAYNTLKLRGFELNFAMQLYRTYLVSFEPNNLVYSLIAPDSHTFPSNLHCSASNPQEE